MGHMIFEIRNHHLDVYDSLWIHWISHDLLRRYYDGREATWSEINIDRSPGRTWRDAKQGPRREAKVWQCLLLRRVTSPQVQPIIAHEWDDVRWLAPSFSFSLLTNQRRINMWLLFRPRVPEIQNISWTSTMASLWRLWGLVRDKGYRLHKQLIGLISWVHTWFVKSIYCQN